MPVSLPVGPELRRLVPRPVEIVAADDAITSWLDVAWPFGRSGPPFPTEGNALRITIRTDGACPLGDLPTDDSLPGTSDTRHLRIDGREFWVWESPTDVPAVRDTCAVRAFVDEAGVTITAHGAPFTSWAAMANAFHEAVSLSGAVAFHAAAIHRPAVSGEPEQTWMILGPSGRGKTTTVLRAVRSGWLPIAEDVCWLHPGTLHVIGSDTTIGVRAPSLGLLREVLPSVSAGVLSPNADGKVLVPLRDLGLRRGPVTVTHVVELGHHAKVGLADSTSLRTALALHEAGGIPRTDHARAGLTAAIGRLAVGTRSASLGLGDLDLPFP